MPEPKKPNPKIIKRNNRIRERYRYLTEEKHLASNWVLGLLEDEFLPLSQTVLWSIVAKTGYYKNL